MKRTTVRFDPLACLLWLAFAHLMRRISRPLVQQHRGVFEIRDLRTFESPTGHWLCAILR